MVTGFIGSRDEATALTWASKQVYIAHGFALAAAAELEIDSCPMEGFDPSAVGEILGISENEKVLVILPIGYRAPTDGPRTPHKIRFSKESLFTEVK
jgi:nitroreductase/dihydropteridine reductase